MGRAWINCVVEINIFDNPDLFFSAATDSTKLSFVGEVPFSALPGLPAQPPLNRVKPAPLLLDPIHNQ